MDKAEHDKILARVIAKCWSNPEYKAQLMKDPKGTLAAEGITLPAEMHIEVHEDSDETHHLLIPKKPSGELSEERLTDLASGRAPLTCSWSNS